MNYLIVLLSLTLSLGANLAQAQSIWGDNGNPFFVNPDSFDPGRGGDAPNAYDGIELKRLETHEMPEGSVQRDRLGYAYSLDLQIWFEDINNPIAQCLADAGVFPEALMNGSQESVKAHDLPLASENGGYEFNRGFAQRMRPGGDKEYFDLSLSFPTGSDYNSAVANIRDCFPPELLSQAPAQSNPTAQPRVIPASAPAVQAPEDEGVEI